MTSDCLPHQVRVWKQQAAMIVHLTIVPADDLAREITIQLHADTPATELPQICASALAAGTTPAPDLAPDLPAVLASLSSKHALTDPDLVKLALELGGDRSDAEAAIRLLSAQARLATSPAAAASTAASTAAPAAAAATPGGALNSPVNSPVAARTCTPAGAQDGAHLSPPPAPSPPDVAGSVRVRSGQLVRLRRWDPLHGAPEQPLTNSELNAEAKHTLSTLCLAPRAAVLLERRSAETAAATWPAPTPDDLYLRVRRWAPSVPMTARSTGAHEGGAAAAAEGASEGGVGKVPTPAFTSAFTPAFTELERLRLAAAEGGSAHHGAGAGSFSSEAAGEDGVVCNVLPPNDAQHDATPYDEGIEGPVQLLCVPNGRSNHASLAELRAVIEAQLGVAAPVQRIVRIGSDGSWSLLTSAPPQPSKMRRIINEDDGEGEEREGIVSALNSALPAMTDATCTLGGLRVRPGDELWIEAAATADAPSELLRRRESARHRMTITFNALDTALEPGAAEPIDAEAAATLLSLGVDVDVTRDAEGQLEFVTAPLETDTFTALPAALTVTVDGRQTLAELKAEIARRLGVPTTALGQLRLRRAAKG